MCGAPFVHPADIPTELAICVYRVMHNAADAEVWEALDGWVARETLQTVLQHIRRILVMNGWTGRLDAELSWWSGELFTHGKAGNGPRAITPADVDDAIKRIKNWRPKRSS